jgi:hypothetical protein
MTRPAGGEIPGSAGNLWETIAVEAAAESPLWAAALRAPQARETVPVFSPLGDESFALVTESIYEGYLMHYGRPRLFAPADADTAVLLGDYLYAHGLVRLAGLGDVRAVADFAELISLCTQARAEQRDPATDGAAWAATAALLGVSNGELAGARAALRVDGDPGPLRALAAAHAGGEAVESALRAHAGRVK